MTDLVTRRTFLASSAATVAACSLLQTTVTAETSHPRYPLGTVSGFTGPRGLAPGTRANPGRGEVVLHDRQTLVASQTTPWRIGPGKAVLLAVEPDGQWSVVYAER